MTTYAIANYPKARDAMIALLHELGDRRDGTSSETSPSATACRPLASGDL
jgi:hypothetical protein